MNISLNRIPDNIEGFIALRDELANTPEGGAAIFILAMLMFAEDQNLGMQAFTIAMDRTNLREDIKGYKGFSPAASYDYHFKNFAQKLYWAKSYVLGTSPAGKYELPTVPYQISATRNAHSEQQNGDIKVFVACSGADSPRPITLRVNDKGRWKVVECSSMFLGMRVPENDVSDDL